MKYLIFAITLLAASISLPVHSQGTPDGVTPANEGVCDSLQGGTPSLYGLCVAFCEAQDIFDENTPLTEEEIDAIVADSKFAQKTLDKYNSRKQEGDPSMPCIVVAQEEESCLCYTTLEISSYVTDPEYISQPTVTLIRQLGDPRTLFAAFTSRRIGTACRASFTDPVEGVVFRNLQTTPEEHAACVSLLDNYAANNGL